MVDTLHDSQEIHVLANDSDHLVSSYWVVVKENEGYRQDTVLTLPGSPSFTVILDITVNGERIDDHAELVDVVADALVAGQYWRDMSLDAQLFSNSCFALRFKVECGLLSKPLVRQKFDSGVQINELVQLGVRMSVTLEQAHLGTLLGHMNYLLVSAFLSLESQFPLVFSYHARKQFRDNFDYLENISRSLSGSQTSPQIFLGFLRQVTDTKRDTSEVIRSMTRKKMKRKDPGAFQLGCILNHASL